MCTIALVSDLKKCTLHHKEKHAQHARKLNITVVPSGQSTYVPKLHRALPAPLILLTVHQILAKLRLSGFESGTNWSLTNSGMTYHTLNSCRLQSPLIISPFLAGSTTGSHSGMFLNNNPLISDLQSKLCNVAVTTVHRLLKVCSNGKQFFTRPEYLRTVD